MNLREVIDKAKEEIKDVMNLEVSNVIAASRAEEGWQVSVELIERISIPDTQDILGVYDVLLDDEGNMTSYERTKVRRRMDLEEVFE